MSNTITEKITWFLACTTNDVSENGGACIKYKDQQIALFNFSRRGEWYACQNACPHRNQMVLSRGMIGSTNGEPKVACPFHKRTFSLINGHCMNEEECETIKIYPVRIDGDLVYIGIEEDTDETYV